MAKRASTKGGTGTRPGQARVLPPPPAIDTKVSSKKEKDFLDYFDGGDPQRHNPDVKASFGNGPQKSTEEFETDSLSSYVVVSPPPSAQKGVGPGLHEAPGASHRQANTDERLAHSPSQQGGSHTSPSPQRSSRADPATNGGEIGASGVTSQLSCESLPPTARDGSLSDVFSLLGSGHEPHELFTVHTPPRARVRDPWFDVDGKEELTHAPAARVGTLTSSTATNSKHTTSATPKQTHTSCEETESDPVTGQQGQRKRSDMENAAKPNNAHQGIHSPIPAQVLPRNNLFNDDQSLDLFLEKSSSSPALGQRTHERNSMSTSKHQQDNLTVTTQTHGASGFSAQSHATGSAKDDFEYITVDTTPALKAPRAIAEGESKQQRGRVTVSLHDLLDDDMDGDLEVMEAFQKGTTISPVPGAVGLTKAGSTTAGLQQHNGAHDASVSNTLLSIKDAALLGSGQNTASSTSSLAAEHHHLADAFILSDADKAGKDDILFSAGPTQRAKPSAASHLPSFDQVASHVQPVIQQLSHSSEGQRHTEQASCVTAPTTEAHEPVLFCDSQQPGTSAGTQPSCDTIPQVNSQVQPLWLSSDLSLQPSSFSSVISTAQGVDSTLSPSNLPSVVQLLDSVEPVVTQLEPVDSVSAPLEPLEPVVTQLQPAEEAFSRAPNSSIGQSSGVSEMAHPPASSLDVREQSPELVQAMGPHVTGQGPALVQAMGPLHSGLPDQTQCSLGAPPNQDTCLLSEQEPSYEQGSRSTGQVGALDNTEASHGTSSFYGEGSATVLDKEHLEGPSNNQYLSPNRLTELSSELFSKPTPEKHQLEPYSEVHSTSMQQCQMPNSSTERTEVTPEVRNDPPLTNQGASLLSGDIPSSSSSSSSSSFSSGHVQEPSDPLAASARSPDRAQSSTEQDNNSPSPKKPARPVLSQQVAKMLKERRSSSVNIASNPVPQTSAKDESSQAVPARAKALPIPTTTSTHTTTTTSTSTHNISASAQKEQSTRFKSKSPQPQSSNSAAAQSLATSFQPPSTHELASGIHDMAPPAFTMAATLPLSALSAITPPNYTAIPVQPLPTLPTFIQPGSVHPAFVQPVSISTLAPSTSTSTAPQLSPSTQPPTSQPSTLSLDFQPTTVSIIHPLEGIPKVQEYDTVQDDPLTANWNETTLGSKLSGGGGARHGPSRGASPSRPSSPSKLSPITPQPDSEALKAEKQKPQATPPKSSLTETLLGKTTPTITMGTETTHDPGHGIVTSVGEASPHPLLLFDAPLQLHLALSVLLYVYYSLNPWSYIAGLLAGFFIFYVVALSTFIVVVYYVEDAIKKELRQQNTAPMNHKTFDETRHRIQNFESKDFLLATAYDYETPKAIGEKLKCEVRLLDSFLLTVKGYNIVNNQPQMVITERNIDVRNCDVCLVPSNVAEKRRRRWSKKYPIRLTLPKAQHTKELFLFCGTARMKEEWFRRLRDAREGRTADFLIEQRQKFFHYIHRYFPPPPPASSRGSSIVLDSMPGRGKEVGFETSKRAPPSVSTGAGATLTGGRQDDQYASSHSKKELVPMTAVGSISSGEEDLQGAASVSSKGSVRVPKERDSISKERDSISKERDSISKERDWMNVFIARLCWDVWHEDFWKKWAKMRIQNVLSRVATPSFMEKLQVSDVKLGMDTPVINKLVDGPILDPEGTWVYLDITYTGSFTMTIETKLKLTLEVAGEEAEVQMDVIGTQKPSKSTLPLTDPLKGTPVDRESSDGEEGQSEEQQIVPLQPGPVAPAEHVPKRTRLLGMVSKVAKMAYNKSSLVRKAAEKVSSYPLVLTVIVRRLDGVLAINIPPPPSDTIWVGFREAPKLDLVATPQVGQKAVTMSRVTHWIEDKLRELVKEKIVLPNMEDLVITVLNSGFPEDKEKTTQNNPT